MDARQRTVGAILHETDQYVIPLFQRYYSWNKEHWARLKKDIWALMDADAKAVHFLGPLVCTSNVHFPGSVPSFQLIDGQQRLTTLTILLAAIRDIATSLGLKDLAEEISEDYLLHKRKQGAERYKVLPRLGDREALTAIVEAQDLTAFEEQQVFHAWKYFHRHAAHLARREAESQLRKLLDTVTRRLSLVVVTIEGENPYEIFESLNSTGLPLEESDLIRNFVFMHIPLAQQQEFSEKHWRVMEDRFAAEEEDDEVQMTPFYRDYLMHNGRYSKEDATFVDFKQHYKDAGMTPEKVVQELAYYAEFELMLRRPMSAKRDNLRKLLRQVEGMEITVAYPLIMNLMDRNQRKEISDTELDGCLLDLVSFVLRRSICGESTRQYNKYFVEAIPLLGNEPRKNLQAYLLARRWPDDNSLRQRLMDFPLYRRESYKARVILEALEENHKHKEQADLSKLSIEHVLPQTITNNAAGKSWKQMLGDNWQELHERYLHTLGNLTLTGYNPDLSNSSFEKKKDLLKDSHLELNAYFDGLDVWNEEAIKARTIHLADQVVQLWPRAPSAAGYAASVEALPLPEGLSVAERRRLDYWRRMDTHLEERGVPPEMIIPSTERYVTVALGTTGTLSLELGTYPQFSSIYVSLLLSDVIGTFVEAKLKDEKDAIEKELGYALTWTATKEETDIYVNDKGIPLNDESDWPIQFDWFGDRLEDFLRVLKPRVEKIEKEALADESIRKEFEAGRRIVDYWKACAQYLQSGSLHFRPNDPGKGLVYSRFEKIDDGIGFGAGVQVKKDKHIYVYWGVNNSAARKYKTKFKELLANNFPALEADLGEHLEWGDPYFSTPLKADIDDKADWPRQFEWIKVTAEKYQRVFKVRLGIEE